MPRLKKDEKHIKALNHKDKEVFRCLSKTGWITKEDAKEYFNVTERRLDNYSKDNYIEKIETEKGDYYKLSEEGKNLTEKNWGFENHYSTQSVKHDYKITEKYLSLEQEQRESCYTERELRHQITAKAKELINSDSFEDIARGEEILKGLKDKIITCPDLAYVEITETVKRVIAYEVVTRNYTKEDIQAKENYCTVMEYSYEQVRV